MDQEQYLRILQQNTDYYLLFEISPKNRKHLKTVIEKSIDSIPCRGIIFLIDHNEILYSRLFFLKDVTLNFLEKGKAVGIWGIPPCVKTDIFGPQIFTELSPYMIDENTDSYCKYLPTNRLSSSLLLSCRRCIAAKECDGLGVRKENLGYNEYRISHKYRKTGRDELFYTQDPALQRSYEAFCRHVDRSDLRYADRYLYFVKNISYGSPYSFTDRFVYHCDYLPYDEYADELVFLESHVDNKLFLETIAFLAKNRAISRIAYSKGVKDGLVRESFYMAPANQHDHYLFDYFSIQDTYPSERLSGIGIDLYNGKIISFKAYYLIESEKLFSEHPSLIEKTGIDILSLHEKTHFYVLRIDIDGNLLSERIDFIFNPLDAQHYHSYLSFFALNDTQLDKLHTFALAFDFENEEIKKINFYYRNRFDQDLPE